MSKSVSLPFLTQHSGIRTAKHIALHTSQPSISGGLEAISPINLRNRSIFLKSREKLKRGTMETFKGSIGTGAKLDFIYTYRHRQEISDRNAFEKLEKSPTAAYLEVIDTHKLNPLPFGIVRNKGKETEVDIHGYCMGDNYALAFSEGLKQCRSVEKINLKSNRLSEKGSANILQKIDVNHIKDLCLSDNKLGQKSIRKIAEILINSQSNLRHLSLEKVNLNDSAGILIFEALAYNTSITRLNLAKNSLTEVSSKQLKAMLIININLKRLDLH